MKIFYIFLVFSLHVCEVKDIKAKDWGNYKTSN